MTPKAFDRVARQLFSETLAPLGFSCDKSDRSTFYKEVGNGLWHVIMPDLGSRSIWYDVKVFPCSEQLEARFHGRFPDQLGITTDSFCYLSERGVGIDQTQFSCKTEESFRSRYETTVSVLLAKIAVPYLSQFKTLRDLLPVIRNPLYRAIGMHLINGDSESRQLVSLQRTRLEAIADDDNVVAARKLLDSLLSP